VFAPQNFFDRAQDGDLLNRRWIEVDASTSELTYETYGVGLETCPVQLEEPAEHILGVVNT
jgi:primary-amine oxidase